MKQKTILVTGGAGFIGSAVIRQFIEETNHIIVNIDCLTYAGNVSSLGSAKNHERHIFQQKNICNQQDMHDIFRQYQPNAIMHLAAESHVDRSIEGPSDFMQTNIMGTFSLLEVTRQYWSALDNAQQQAFRFHHISTDEVFGSLPTDGYFTETTPYSPNSPYSASKASSDHLVRAWHHTFGIPTLITNCSNNYGPYQFPEKLIPLMILNGMEGKKLPVYGQGNNIRDWLYVEDHAHALRLVLEKGQVGETYNIGGHNEKTNIEVVKLICQHLDDLIETPITKPHTQLIEYVQDRPGHDQRYAIDAQKIQKQLGWTPQETFESGLKKTVQWYLDNTPWWQTVLSGEYQRQRLGLATD